MKWTRTIRRPDRKSLRPDCESLEARKLLSTTTTSIAPLPAVFATTSPTGVPVTIKPYDTLIGATATRADYGVDGSGLTAAVIDTGVNYHHEALGGAIGAGNKVVGGYDFAENDNDPDADTWQHGTAVAGLIASSDPANPGVAPGAGIVPLRVFGDDNNGSYDRVAQALQWVIDHHDEYHISVVNLSIADGRNYTADWYSTDGQIGQRIAGLIHQLQTLNIPVVSAAGNSFNGQQGMGFTAILPETISVTATDSSDQLVGNAQRLGKALGKTSATDLAAPGAGLDAPIEGNSFAAVDGTSFAAPMVSGAVLLLQSIYQKLHGTLPSIHQLETWLDAGSVKIHDSATGITLDRLDIRHAAQVAFGNPANNGNTDNSGGGNGNSDNQGGGNGNNDNSGGGMPTENPPATGPVVVPPSDPPAGGSDSPSDSGGDTGGSSNVPSAPTGPIAPGNTIPDSSGGVPSGDSPTGDNDNGQPQGNGAGQSPTDAQDAALAALYQDGEYAGTVANDSPQNPLGGALSQFGLTGTFSKIQTWSSVGINSATTTQGTGGALGQAQAAGTISARLDQYRARHAMMAQRLAQQRAERLAVRSSGMNRPWTRAFARGRLHG